MPTWVTKCRQLLVVWISRPCEAEAVVTGGVGAAGPGERTPSGQQDSWVGESGEGAGPRLALPSLLVTLILPLLSWPLPPPLIRARGKLRLLTSEVRNSLKVLLRG